MVLTGRQKAVLQVLCGQDGFQTARQIAVQLGVSSRTVRSDLDACEAHLASGDVRLERRRGAGVRLVGSREGLRGLRDSIETTVTGGLTSEEASSVAAAMLLAKPVTTFGELAETLGVSRQTVAARFGAVEERFAAHGLQVTRERGVGLRIDGTERDIRRAAIRLLEEGPIRVRVAEVLRNNGVTSAHLGDARSILEGAQRVLGLFFSAEDSPELVVAYVLGRIAQGCIIDESGADGSRSREPELAAVTTVLKPYVVQEQERRYLGSLVLATRVGRADGRGLGELEADNIAAAMSRELVDALRAVHHIDEAEMGHVIEGLRLHLRAAVERWRNDIQICDELPRQISASIPLVLEFTKRQLAIQEERWGIRFNESETAYIAMYLATIWESSAAEDLRLTVLFVCTFGLASSAMLMARLTRALVDCELVGPISPEDARDYAAANAVDLVVCTSDVDCGNVPVLRLDPIMSQADLARVSDVLAQRSYEKMCARFLESVDRAPEPAADCHRVGDYIGAGDVQISTGEIEWQEAIRVAAAPLVARGLLESRYVERMVRAVVDYGPYMVLTPGVAYVHAGVNDGVRENCSALLLLDRAIPFGPARDKQVQAVVVLGVRDTSRSGLLNLAFILERPENVRALSGALTVQEILDLHD